jgi:2-amino-4-hydroxy-6-hydroxymethyldihydropteridine diphosphokinase
METAYLALGSNLPSPAGSPGETLDAATHQIAKLGHLAARSSYLTTEPVGYADQPVFLNAAVALETLLTPQELLERLLEIEYAFGRDRSHGIANGPRTLDLDILLYGDYVLSTQTLQLPHPRMAQRSFVLLPMAEIAPELIHPVSRKSMSQLLKDLSR